MSARLEVVPNITSDLLKVNATSITFLASFFGANSSGFSSAIESAIILL